MTIGAMLVNAAVLYRVRHATVKLSRQYEALCARRAFRLASQLPDPASPTASAMLMTEELSPLPEAEARACSRVLEQLVGLIPKLAILVVSAGIVFYLNAALSGLILLIALVALYQLYHLNVNIAGLDQLKRERAPDIRNSRRFSMLFFRYSTAQFDGKVVTSPH